MPEAMRVGVVATPGPIDSPGGLSCPTILAMTTGAEEGNQGVYDNGKTCINCYEH